MSQWAREPEGIHEEAREPALGSAGIHWLGQGSTPKLLFMQMTFSFTQFLSRISLQRDIMAIEWQVLNNHPTFNTTNVSTQCYLGRDFQSLLFIH